MVEGLNIYTTVDVPSGEMAAAEEWVASSAFQEALLAAPGLEEGQPPRRAAQYGVVRYDYDSGSVQALAGAPPPPLSSTSSAPRPKRRLESLAPVATSP